MSAQRENATTFEQEISAALLRSAQLAREEAIKHGTGIVVQIDGKVVEIPAEELKKQAEQKNET
ncbi:hypothetical protein [Halopseudomonas xiamenensis]|uniref:hypothetical protein n=1 Tax=Halopseudomonas xiamenensis TaxID=157792 RepID=UPI00162395BE|nr:hypothetical protein [Halopseudomonas xiamenensis]